MIRRIIDISSEHPRLGYRRAWSLLGAEGSGTTLKRFYRLWKLNTGRSRIK